MTIGERIRKARTAKKLSLDKLGAKIGVSRQLVWQWENDKTDPSKHIEALSAHLDVPFDYLYGAESRPDDLADKLSLLTPEQQELIHTMIDKMIGQAGPTTARKTYVK
jgi:transcriptional regulator with XRE-family HTH domain